ncbi:MAG: hypothetical protein K8J08_17445 [Thermoanaerobaculia bacterium]|nr:hypothetical protein [Thermoanaerobaculia bacterium]
MKPGGESGIVFGLVGTMMMIVMLLYSLRKRFRPLRHLGPIGVWLDYHILLGVLGPLFVLLHSSFKVGGLVALSFWSMVAVALSGILGRFIYRQIPRSSAGDELTLAEVEAEDRELSGRLSAELGLSTEEISALDVVALEHIPDGSALALLGSLLVGPFLLRRRLRRLWREQSGHDRRFRRDFQNLTERKAMLHLRLALWERLRRLFHYWHVFHKPFALLMYLFMAVHIGVALMTGYGWVGR